MGDHTETIQIDYDPAIISYEELLQVALAQGDFIGMPISRQYRSVVLYQNAHQLKVARNLKIKQLEPLGSFTRAEDYHQKYYLQQSAVAEEFYQRYPDARSFTDSTAVTRANGIVGGYVNSARLEQLVPKLGVTQSARKALFGMAGKAPAGCAISN